MLVDDHSLIRTGLRLLLSNDPKIEIVAEAADGKEALKNLVKQPVDIMLLDISLPEINGLDCIEKIKQRSPSTKIIMLSMHEDENYIKKAMDLGAFGYIPKASADDELFDAIAAVAKGNFYLSKKAEQSLLSVLFSQKENPLEKLSPRELEVFKYLVHGHTITEIAEILQLSVKTVDTHKSKIYDKVDCHKRSELVTLALKHNVLHRL